MSVVSVSVVSVSPPEAESVSGASSPFSFGSTAATCRPVLIVRFKGPAVVVIGAFTSTRLCASNVSVTAVSPSDLMIGAATVMLPSPSPSSLVRTSTLEPPLNDSEMESACSSSMTISSGSSNQVPAAPSVALTSAG